MELSPKTVAWARSKCEEVIRTSRVITRNGVVLFTPDGVGAYGALWTRDFAYLVEHGSEFLTRQEVRSAVEVLLQGQRQDGAMPDRVNERLVPFYHPGPNENPLGSGPALDNGMFMVAVVYHYHKNFGDAGYVREVLPALRHGLEFIPRNRGLVFNDPQKPSSTYGFQDTVAKGGHDLFCSLLWINTCRQMSELDISCAGEWVREERITSDALELLWDESLGAYLAASDVCRQVDIWGNAFLVAHRIGDEKRRHQAARYLEKHYDAFVYAGQLRHLPLSENWERCFGSFSPGSYQNGGFWGTPSAWLIDALESINPALAEKTFFDLLNFYQEHGVLEWSTPEGGKGPDLYVATLLNVWSMIKTRAAAS